MSLTPALTCRVGFDGKLPSRGDFVGSGLPMSFLKPWRLWVDQALHESRQALGENWLPAWLEAPIWHFACGPDAAGPDAALGLIFPSVDRVGRHYPMTIAAIFSGFPGVPDGGVAAAWLAAAEAAGLDALMHDVEPATLGDAVAALGMPPLQHDETSPGAWWTEGGPRVAPARRRCAALPAPAAFSAMMAENSISGSIL